LAAKNWPVFFKINRLPEFEAIFYRQSHYQGQWPGYPLEGIKRTAGSHPYKGYPGRGPKMNPNLNAYLSRGPKKNPNPNAYLSRVPKKNPDQFSLI
jgi:hypothetical protein